MSKKPPEFDLDRYKKRSDPEADAVAQALWDHHHCDARWRELPRDLGRWKPVDSTRCLFDEVVAYLDKPYVLPAWIDRERLKRAQLAFVPHALRARIVLATCSLPVLYIDPEIAATLMRTGQLVLHVERRLEETQAFIDNVMTLPLDEPGAGWQWLRKVRLMHAVMRVFAREGRPQPTCTVDPALDHEALALEPFSGPLAVLKEHREAKGALAGVEIDQLELAFVFLSFSWVIVDGLARLGHPMPARQTDDYMYLWAAVGHMVGIETALLPGGPEMPSACAGDLFKYLCDRHLHAPEPWDHALPGLGEGRQLLAALLVILIQKQRERVPVGFHARLDHWSAIERALQDLPRVLMRRMLGLQIARRLRLTRAPLLHWIVCRLALLFFDPSRFGQATSPEKAAPKRDEFSDALL
jgi:hypothetical protein